MTPLVVDASAAAAFTIPAQSTGSGDWLLRHWDQFLPRAPYVFSLETTWLLIKRERRRREPGLTEAALRTLGALGIDVGEPPGPAGRAEAMVLALRRDVGFYDAMYLMQAVEEDAVLATRDGPMIQAADRLGVTALDLR